MICFAYAKTDKEGAGTVVTEPQASLPCPQTKLVESLHANQKVSQQIWVDFIAHFKSDTTVRSYQSDLVECCSYLNKVFAEINHVDAKCLFEWLTSKVEEGNLKPATMAKKFREYHSMAQYLCENREKYGVSAEFEDYFYPYLTKVAKQEKLAKAIPIEEIDRLLKVSEEDLSAFTMLILLYRIGLSSTEIVGIRPVDIEQYADGVYIWIKNRKEACYLPEDVAEILFQYLKQREGYEYLFYNRSGRQLNTMYISRMMKKYTALAGIPSYSAETLRNCCGFTMYAYGARDKQVARQLGITQMQIKRYDDVRYKENIQKQAQNLVKLKVEPPRNQYC